MPPIRILTAADVAAALSMADCIEAVRGAFGHLSAGQANVPVRTQWPGQGGIALVMPAYLPADAGLGAAGLGAKVVSVFPANPGRGLPTVNAIVALLGADSGVPLALLDGTYLTALRTGAASGVATDLLTPADADTLALFGAGAQARTQLLAIATVRRLRSVWVYDPKPERSEGFIAVMKEMYAGTPVPADLRAAGSPAAALREARIVACATTSHAPVFEDADLNAGTHVNAVGAFTPEMQEVPAETVARARVFVDQREAAMAEAGDLIIPAQAGLLDPSRLIEIGEVVNRTAAGRESPDEVTLFKSVGNAVQDIAAATRALRAAEEKGLGTVVEL